MSSELGGKEGACCWWEGKLHMANLDPLSRAALQDLMYLPK